MTKHKLLFDDFGDCDSFVLIAIHCALEDYRLVYLLNQKLSLKLKRRENDLDYSEAKYSIFEWEDPKNLITWNVVSNYCNVQQGIEYNESSLFNEQANIIKTFHLVPEYKNANYLLKITNETVFFNVQEVIDVLLDIPQIILAYDIETERLKSKTNLIFK
jgi:hypothetical protein